MKILVKPQGLIGRIADYVMMPLMYILQGSITEKPQRTHYWNNVKLKNEQLKHLDEQAMVALAGNVSNKKRWWYGLPIFHMPMIGGWKNYVVLTPVVMQDVWFVGWIAGDVAGVSRIPLTSSVRLLEGQYAVQFFGINEHGEQILIEKTGEGVVGQAAFEHQHIVLL